MVDAFKRLFGKDAPARRLPKSKSGVNGTVKIPGGKDFRVLREDVLQKGLHRTTEKAA